jgi:hypothetical protein
VVVIVVLLDLGGGAEEQNQTPPNSRAKGKTKMELMASGFPVMTRTREQKKQPASTYSCY